MLGAQSPPQCNRPFDVLSVSSRWRPVGHEEGGHIALSEGFFCGEIRNVNARFAVTTSAVKEMEQDHRGRTLLVVVEEMATAEVIDEASRIARPEDRVLLLGVLPLVTHSATRHGGGPRLEPWEIMSAQKATARRRLEDMRRRFAAHVEVRVEFGSLDELVGQIAPESDADVVIAAPKPRAAWPWASPRPASVSVSWRKRGAGRPPQPDVPKAA
jgi:hypothetical protein